nr:reverse transcriptase domain-containing protein [Tanacetum cinerariifolium]
MTLELADRSISHPVGVAEDVYVKVGSFHFLADFVVVDFDADPRVPLILNRSFLKTGRDLIDVFEGELTLCIGKEVITFNLYQTSRYSANYSDLTAKRIDVIDMSCEEYSQEVSSFSDVILSGNPTPYYDPILSTTFLTLTPFKNSDFLLKEVDAFLAIEDDPTSPEFYEPYLDPEGDILLLEAFLNDDPSLPLQNKGSYLPEVELKDLPSHLEYAFLEGDDKLPVIIAKDLSVEEMTALITVLKSHKRAIAWKISDIKGIDPEFCTHKILMEEDFEPSKRDATAEKIALLMKIGKRDATAEKIALLMKIGKWINKTPPLPKSQSWTQENLNSGNSGYNSISSMNTMPYGSDGKKGRTVAVTTENMQKRKNDVKARTTLLLALPDDHQLRFSKYKTAQELWAAILRTFGGNQATKKTKKNLLKQNISLDTACAYIASQSNGSQIKYEYINQIDEDDIKEMDIKWNMAWLALISQRWSALTATRWATLLRSAGLPEAKTGEGETTTDKEENHALVADEEALIEFVLMAKTSSESKVFDNSLCSKACKKNTDSLNSKITELSEKLGDTKNMLYHYKLGLSQVEARLVEFKNQEIKFYEKIRGLELKVEFKTNRIKNLTNKLKTLKKEKEGLDSKLTGYSVVPPPPAQVYSLPKKDMSGTGLPEFADDTIIDYSRPSPAIESFLTVSTLSVLDSVGLSATFTNLITGEGLL